MAQSSTSAPAQSRPTLLQETDLTASQNQAIERLFQEDNTLLIAALGFGKAVVGLTAARDVIREGVCNRVLVLAPKRTAELTWGTEPAKWAHLEELRVGIACGNPASRTLACHPENNVVVTNFENIGWIIKNYGDTFDGYIIDEISKLSKVGGAAVKKLRHFAKRLNWRVGMSASPVSESGLSIYGQALCLDRGEALGTLFETFKRKYFYPEDYQQRNWVAFPDTYERLGVVLRDLVWTADDTQYQEELPEVVTEIIGIDMPEELVVLDCAMETTGVVEKNGHTVIAGSAALQTNKRHQIAAGGLYGADDEDERVLVYFDPYKIRHLVYHYDDITEGFPVIIYYQYQFELDELQRIWPGTPVLGQGTKFPPEMLAAWNGGEYPRIFAHHASASHGLNLQAPCNQVIHLSPIWGRDPWIQTLGRVRRRGQPEPQVIRTILCGVGSVDYNVLDKQEVKAEREEKFMAQLK